MSDAATVTPGIFKTDTSPLQSSPNKENELVKNGESEGHVTEDPASQRDKSPTDSTERELIIELEKESIDNISPNSPEEQGLATPVGETEAAPNIDSETDPLPQVLPDDSPESPVSDQMPLNIVIGLESPPLSSVASPQSVVVLSETESMSPNKDVEGDNNSPATTSNDDVQEVSSNTGPSKEQQTTTNSTEVSISKEVSADELLPKESTAKTNSDSDGHTLMLGSQSDNLGQTDSGNCSPRGVGSSPEDFAITPADLSKPDSASDMEAESETPMDFTDSKQSPDRPSQSLPLSPKRLKPVLSCTALTIPPEVAKQFKAASTQPRKRKIKRCTVEGNPKRRLGGNSSSSSPILVDENAPTVLAILPLVQASGDILNKSDEFYDIKRIILHCTYGTSTGSSVKYLNQFSNIFLKNWRFSKQFSRTGNSRTRQMISNLLVKVVRELYENDLIEIKGPEDDMKIVEMITTEIKADNSKLFCQTPPTLTLLVTEKLFNKYFECDGTNDAGTSSKSWTPSAAATVQKRVQSKSVSLGSASEQWFKLKKELGADSNSDVATLLMHCYKVWNSVACGKCRRHMDVGMEHKMGKKLMGASAICIVSCECGKSTSGGFMIECDSCHKWQHGVCVDITKDDIPDQYSCKRCRNVAVRPVFDNEERSDTSVVSIDNTEVYSTDDSQPEVIELD